MAKPLDKDLRARVVAAVESGMSRRAAAARFEISQSAAIKLIRRYRATGSIAPGQMGGHRPLKLAAWRDWLMRRIDQKPDITTRELADELAERGVTVSDVSVWNLLRRQDRSHKKSVLASEQDRPDVARHRARWQQRQATIDPERLVFIDEPPAFAGAGSTRPTSIRSSRCSRSSRPCCVRQEREPARPSEPQLANW